MGDDIHLQQSYRSYRSSSVYKAPSLRLGSELHKHTTSSINHQKIHQTKHYIYSARALEFFGECFLTTMLLPFS